MAVGGRIRRLRRALWGKGRFRRELAAIAGPLETDPRLASLFATFNQLASGERNAGPAPLPRPAWPRPWVTRTVMLLGLAAIVVVGVLLSMKMRPVMRPCLVFTAAGPQVAVPAVTPSSAGPPLASLPAGLRAGAGVARAPACPAYPAKK